MLQQNQCQIYEFSRKFLEPIFSPHLNKYVTTGFEKEIGWETKKVPKEIANTVYNNGFRINDNYPPREGEITLIAREIGEYAVLAVATCEMDESSRPLVAYRYFWLKQKNRETIDRIGTLLEWWMNQDCPSFELQPSELYQKYKNPQTTPTVSKTDFNHYFSAIKPLLVQIQKNAYESPLSLSVDTQFLEDPRQLHALALLLNQQYNAPLNWVFNVTKLESPEQFTLIAGLDTLNSSGFLTINRFDDSLEEIALLSDAPSTHNQLKRCLVELARKQNIDKNFSQLIDALQVSNSHQWNWDGIVDNTFLKNENSIDTARYRALLAFLMPLPEFLHWLSWLKKHKNNNFWQAGINIQNQLVKVLESQQILKDHWLVNWIYDLISELLLSNSPKSQQRLLVTSQSFWTDFFKEYAQDIFTWLLYCLDMKGDVRSDKFVSKVISDLKTWQLEQTLSTQQKSYYNSIARLCAEAKCYNLAAFFYQFSWGEVPSDIYNKVEIMLIPLSKSTQSSGLIPLTLSHLRQDIRDLFHHLRSQRFSRSLSKPPKRKNKEYK